PDPLPHLHAALAPARRAPPLRVERRLAGLRLLLPRHRAAGLSLAFLSGLAGCQPRASGRALLYRAACAPHRLAGYPLAAAPPTASYCGRNGAALHGAQSRRLWLSPGIRLRDPDPAALHRSDARAVQPRLRAVEYRRQFLQ